MRFILAAAWCLLVLAAVSAADGPALFVNGQQVNTDPGVVVQQDVSYGPLRAVAEALGAQVEWHTEGHFATVCRGTTCLKINQSEGIIVNDHLLLPIRKLAETLGGTVRWTGGPAPRIDLTIPPAR